MSTQADRAVDALVAEHVMELLVSWRGDESDKVGEPFLLGADTSLPHYISNPADDYTVLRHVRETWDHDDFRAFLAALRTLQARRMDAFMASRRWGSYPDGGRSEALYEPGDYARAALAAMAIDTGS